MQKKAKWLCSKKAVKLLKKIRVRSILPLSILFLRISSVNAAIAHWNNPDGGSFEDPNNWLPSVVPGEEDIVNILAEKEFLIDFNDHQTNASVHVSDGKINFDLNSHTWIVADKFSIIGDNGTAAANFLTGDLLATNFTKSVQLTVGGENEGNLFINGGRVWADTLIANSGGKSRLSFSHGKLTVLQKMDLALDGRLILGENPNHRFLLHLLAGENIIRTPEFFYGGLTLGKSKFSIFGGSADLYLSGSQTSLSVYGLDTYGDNNIEIKDGASLLTRDTQLGLQFGSNNVVVISGANSKWINSGLLYFGMHVGSQTLVVTNGGLFKTGNTGFRDQAFHSFGNSNNRILVTGEGSLFHSVGNADLGRGNPYPWKEFNNSLLIENGGSVRMRHLEYGLIQTNLEEIVTFPGNIIEVKNGTLWIEDLQFLVGKLKVDSGTAQIDKLSMKGGTNSVIIAPRFILGHNLSLTEGDLRVGSNNATVLNFNGEMHVNNFGIGEIEGTSGNFQMDNGFVSVSNKSRTGEVSIGQLGLGRLGISGGIFEGDIISIGPEGALTVATGGTLRLNQCFGPEGSVQITNGILEFYNDTPELGSRVIEIENGIISYSGVNNVDLKLTSSTLLNQIHREGSTSLRWKQSTNLERLPLEFRDESSENWAHLVFGSGFSEFETASLLISTNSSLHANNSTVVLFGSFTNQGVINLENSELTFEDSVKLEDTGEIFNNESTLVFKDSFFLSKNDMLISNGETMGFQSISSEGGRVIVDGGALLFFTSKPIVSKFIELKAGWIKFQDTSDVTMNIPITTSGNIGLELIHSSNQYSSLPIFSSLNGQYSTLRLSEGSSWISDGIVIGANGMLEVNSSDVAIDLGSKEMRIEKGGIFKDQTGSITYVGFDPEKNNFNAFVIDESSLWNSPNGISFGESGYSNNVSVISGGKIISSKLDIGSNGGAFNELRVIGGGSTMILTNNINLSGFNNSLVIDDGGFLSARGIDGTGKDLIISLTGKDSGIKLNSRLFLQGNGFQLNVEDGGTLDTLSCLLVGGFLDTQTTLSGTDAKWIVHQDLRMFPSFNEDNKNTLIVKDGASLISQGIYLFSTITNQPNFIVNKGSLFVTNSNNSAEMILQGHLTIKDGFLHVQKFNASTRMDSTIKFDSGRLELHSCSTAFGTPFVVGSGTNSAVLCLLGGNSKFTDGMVLSKYSTLEGSGIIDGPIACHGVIKPSKIVIESDLILNSDGALHFVLNGEDPPLQSAPLSISHPLVLNGDLKLSLNGEFPDNPELRFTLVEGAEISSSFSNVTFGGRLMTTDRLGSFRIDHLANSIVATDYRNEDVDGDEVHDEWALNYFGFSPLHSGSGMDQLDGDWDGDGLTNKQEFFIDTNPKDERSSFRVQLKHLPDGTLVIDFPFFSNRQFFLKKSVDLKSWTLEEIEYFWFRHSTGASCVINRNDDKKYYTLQVQ